MQLNLWNFVLRVLLAKSVFNEYQVNNNQATFTVMINFIAIATLFGAF